MELLLATALGLFFVHFLCDFSTLSTPAMLAAKAVGRPSGPILSHALAHAVGMYGVVLLATDSGQLSACCATLQLTTHYAIDTAKGRAQASHPAARDPKHYAHWLLFGFDQFLHAATILLMLLFLAKEGAFKTL